MNLHTRSEKEPDHKCWLRLQQNVAAPSAPPPQRYLELHKIPHLFIVAPGWQVMQLRLRLQRRLVTPGLYSAKK
jgi:hypothetical protein